MSAFDTLEQQLRDSAGRGRRRPRLAWRLAPAVALAVAVLAVFLVAREERTPVGADEREAPAAQPAPTWTLDLGNDYRGKGHPLVSRSPVPPEQAKAFAILRRAQTDADRSPEVEALLRSIGTYGMTGVRVDAVRLLEKRGDEVTILVPIRRLRGNPHDPSTDMLNPLCFMQRNAQGAGGSCTPSADAVRGRMRSPMPPRGLAPDGAASVKVRVRGGRTISVDVRDNFFDARWIGESAAVGIAIPRYFDTRGREIHFR